MYSDELLLPLYRRLAGRLPGLRLFDAHTHLGDHDPDGSHLALPPASDQWRLLSCVERMTMAEIEGALARALGGGDALGERIALSDDAEAPWRLPASARWPESRIKGPFPGAVDVVSSNLVYVSKDGLPQGMQDRLLRLAAFENPEFYRAQAMRLPLVPSRA